MLVLMLIALYTSRVILQALGAEDYGIYNVVGGVVTMFTVLSGALSSSISRYLTFELGSGNKNKLISVFSTSIIIQLGISVVIVFLAETIGLWFLNNKLVIDESRMMAANWCYQFSIMTFVINLLSVPYNAAIIAHERMSAFAYISIFEAIGLLVVAWLVKISPIDRLIFYGGAVSLMSLVVWLIYVFYCRVRFEECIFKIRYESSLLKQMVGFAGWNFFGAASGTLRDQGANILLNIFFGATVNAARGISVRVNSAINSFVTNFMTALRPQITKSYASGDYSYMFQLVFRGSRLSYYILLLLSLPVLINTDYILDIWLGEVPAHTAIFVQLTLVWTLIECISHTLVTAMLATGNIKKYQIIVGGLQMLNLPISYICLKLGLPAESVFVIMIIISIMCLIPRLVILKSMIGLNVSAFVREVIMNVTIVTILSAIVPFLLTLFITLSFVTFCLECLICVISTSLVSLYVGCPKNERQFVYDYIKKLFFSQQK